MVKYFKTLLILALVLNNSNATLKTPNHVANQYNLALEAIFSMGVRLQALLYESNSENDEKNFLISPISATILIGELMLGADGAFLKELYELLSVPTTNLGNSLNFHKGNQNYSISLPNSRLHLQLGSLIRKLTEKNHNNFTIEELNGLFYNQNEVLLNDFMEKLKIYDTSIFPLNFANDPQATLNFINAWIAKSTHGVIQGFLENLPPKDTAAIFANIIYFKGDWEVPFSYQLNKIGPFHKGPNRTVNVTYMSGEMQQIQYFESKELNCKMIALPYKNNELCMYIILPTEDDYDIKKFVKRMKVDDVMNMLKNMKRFDVTVKIPKLSLTTTLKLLEPLKKYTLFKKQDNTKYIGNTRLWDKVEKKVDAFTKFTNHEDVDIFLSKAAVGHSLKVSDIVQQVKLSVDEKGTEAAAITVGYIDYIGGSKIFTVDRPFSFFIRHEETTAVLFWGTIVDPTQQN